MNLFYALCHGRFEYVFGTIYILEKKMNKIDNPKVLAHTLLTPVNRAYDVPGAHDPSKLTSKCIKTLLWPRILDVLCFWVVAAICVWHYENSGKKYFAVRIFDPTKDMNILRAFIDFKTILAVLAFAALTTLVFVIRLTYIRSKRTREKKVMILLARAFHHY